MPSHVQVSCFANYGCCPVLIAPRQPIFCGFCPEGFADRMLPVEAGSPCVRVNHQGFRFLGDPHAAFQPHERHTGAGLRSVKPR